MQPTDIETRLKVLEELCSKLQSDFPSDAKALVTEINALATEVEINYRDLLALDQLAAHVSGGLLLDDVLDDIYNGFREVIPYDRIGFSLINDGIVTARWLRSESDSVLLGAGYALSIETTSLAGILAEGKPRIINDLGAYLAARPESESTRLLVQEGVQSSLTCPLFIDGKAVGFLFFSSFEPGAYSEIHTNTFERIADQLAGVIEKGKLTSQLAERAEAIEEQNRQLRALSDLKNTFIGMVSHDLRSPLATIQVTADLLDEANYLAPLERKMLIKDIKEQSGYMLALVNELLDVALIESGRLELNRETFDLEALIADSVNRHGYLAGPKDIRVLLVDSSPAVIEADPTRIRQVLDNLLSNAVKYSPMGSVVSVTLTVEHDLIRVGVTDEGPGISAADQVLLFEYFETAEAKPTGGETSTGLGLAIARNIVEAHRGSLEVESAPGRGSTFWFELPPIPVGEDLP